MRLPLRGNTMKKLTQKDLLVLHLAAFEGLEHDNYDQQSEECKQFIGSLIIT